MAPNGNVIDFGPQSEPEPEMKGRRPFGIPPVPKGKTATKSGRFAARLGNYFRKSNQRHQ